jgi:PAS domain S-box-containing protein
MTRADEPAPKDPEAEQLRQVQEALRTEQERLRVTLQSISDAVITANAEGRISTLNRAAETLTGWSNRDAEGRLVTEVLQIVDDRTGARVEDLVQRVIREGLVLGVAGHTELVARDGRRIAVTESAAPVCGDRGELLGIVLALRDVSAQRRVEHERGFTLEFLRLVNSNSRTHDLAAAAVTFFRRRSGCAAVGIRLKDGEDYPYIEAYGFSEDFIRTERYLCARDADGHILRDAAGNPLLECMCGNVICGRFDRNKPFFTETGSFWTNSTTELLAKTTEQDRQARTRNRCNGEGYESVALIPLALGGQQLGLLQLNDRRRGMFSSEQIELWEHLAARLALALARTRAEEGLADANRRLQVLSAKAER